MKVMAQFSPALWLNLIRSPVIAQQQNCAAEWAPICPQATSRAELMWDMLDDSSADGKAVNLFVNRIEQGDYESFPENRHLDTW